MLPVALRTRPRSTLPDCFASAAAASPITLHCSVSADIFFYVSPVMLELLQSVGARLCRLAIYALAYCLKLVVLIALSLMHRPTARSAVRVMRARAAGVPVPTARLHLAHSSPLKPSSTPPPFDPYSLSSGPAASRPSSTTGASSPSGSSSATADTASFGFTSVPRAEKERLVGEVFHRVADTYDVMNDLMSLGIHRLWKHRLITLLAPTQHTQLLDVAGGTGDIAFRFIETVRAIPISAYKRAASDGPALTAAATVCDINPSMLAVGRERAVQYGYLSESTASPAAPASASSSSSSHIGLAFVEGNAEKLPFDDNSFDAYTIAFGLRNVTDTAAALSEAQRVLRPGGVFHCLEFSKLSLPLLQQLYDAYSFNVIPVMGEVVASDKASYQYLVESISKWHSQEALSQLMRAAGMKGVRHENLTFGIAAIHTGYKV